MKLIYLSEGARMFARRLRVLFLGVKRYSGSDEQICRKIILSCFDKDNKYFRVSSGHFCEFYCRDFGFCSRSLVNLGYRKEVEQTLDYALGVFRKGGFVTQSINPKGKPFDFPEVYSPDSFIYIVHSLRQVESSGLVRKYRGFLEKETRNFFDTAIEKNSGRIKKNVHFGSMKDHSIRSASCYDTCMAGMLKDDLEFLGLPNPLKNFDYQRILMEDYWSGEFFYDDMKKVDEIYADANLFPFWCGIIKNYHIMKKAMASITSAGLDKPFPLKYSRTKRGKDGFVLYEKLANGYEHDAIWAHMGPLYIDVLSQLDSKGALKHLQKYGQLIGKHGNFLEVYGPKGKPFSTLFYYSDESILWCSNYLYLKKKLQVKV